MRARVEVDEVHNAGWPLLEHVEAVPVVEAVRNELEPNPAHDDESTPTKANKKMRAQGLAHGTQYRESAIGPSSKPIGGAGIPTAGDSTLSPHESPPSQMTATRPVRRWENGGGRDTGPDGRTLTQGRTDSGYLPIRAAACTQEGVEIDVNPLSICLRKSSGEEYYSCQTAS